MKDYLGIELIFKKLFTLPRSITGDAVRESFNILDEIIDFKISEISTGYQIDDWTVPQEWKVNNLELILNNKNLINFKKDNLHSIYYSQNLNITGKTSNLLDKIYVSDHFDDAIPYVTSYYKKNTGICLSKKMLNEIIDKKININVDVSFFDGSMSIGETYLEGLNNKEIFITSYMCHPGMGNNELSGPLVMAILYNLLKNHDRKFKYNFIIFPETIGAITYIKKNIKKLRENTLYGLVLTCLGGPEKNISYKKSLKPNIFQNFLEENQNVNLREFDPTEGSNERHFCFPTVNLPFGQFARTIYTKYPEYHTSKDDLEFTNISKLYDSAYKIFDLIKQFEDSYKKYETDKVNTPEILYKSSDNEEFYLPTAKYGEPFLSKYDLYPSMNTDGANKNNQRIFTNNILKTLSMSNGSTSRKYIENKLNLNPDLFELLLDKKLLIKI